jgi:hypothetical protein
MAKRGRKPRLCPDVDGLRQLIESGASLGQCMERFDASWKAMNRWIGELGIKTQSVVQSLPSEEWRAVVGWDGYYEVSNMGRVRGLDRVSLGVRVHGRIRRPAIKRRRDPYWQVHLFRGGRGSKVHRLYVHLLVLEAFVGPRPKGLEACHNNGDCQDNRVENLRWDTHEANMQDQIKHGTRVRGPRKTRSNEGHCLV